MEVAIFGLIGVVLGGLITGGTQMFLEWRREQRAVRRAKRLVKGELLQASMILRYFANSKIWPSSLDATSVLPTLAWQEHRAHLADVLNKDIWDQLVIAYSKLEIERALAKDLISDTQLSDEMIETMKHMATTLETLRSKLDGRGRKKPPLSIP
jgi:hypothetical protein